MPISAADLLMHWYRERGIEAEVLEPGPDEASAYLSLDLKAGRRINVASAIYDGDAGREFLRWLAALLSDAKGRGLKLSAIHVWIRPEELEELREFIEAQARERPAYRQIFDRIQLRSLSSLSVRGEVVGQLLSLDRMSLQGDRAGVRPVPGASGTDRGLPFDARQADVSVVPPRGGREVGEGAAREELFRERLRSLEKRLDLLETIVKLLADREIAVRSADRIPPLWEEINSDLAGFQNLPRERAGTAPISGRSIVRDVAGARGRPTEGEETTATSRGEEDEAVIPPPEGSISFELIEEFARDNPWARVLSEKGGEDAD